MLPILVYSILFVLVDYIYLSYISKPFGSMIKKIQGSEMTFKLVPAIVVYFSLVGAWYFFIYKDLENNSKRQNIIRAALLGFFIYSVYDFTNLAIITDYRVDLAIIDSLWGATLYALTTGIFIYLREFK